MITHGAKKHKKHFRVSKNAGSAREGCETLEFPSRPWRGACFPPASLSKDFWDKLRNVFRIFFHIRLTNPAVGFIMKTSAGMTENCPVARRKRERASRLKTRATHRGPRTTASRPAARKARYGLQEVLSSWVEPRIHQSVPSLGMDFFDFPQKTPAALRKSVSKGIRRQFISGGLYP